MDVADYYLEGSAVVWRNLGDGDSQCARCATTERNIAGGEGGRVIWLPEDDEKRIGLLISKLFYARG